MRLSCHCTLKQKMKLLVCNSTFTYLTKIRVKFSRSGRSAGRKGMVRDVFIKINVEVTVLCKMGIVSRPMHFINIYIIV